MKNKKLPKITIEKSGRTILGYLKLSNRKINYTREITISPCWIICDLDQEDEIIGIEIITQEEIRLSADRILYLKRPSMYGWYDWTKKETKKQIVKFLNQINKRVKGKV